ncbi:MAG: hypothetical protein DRI90_12930 [Deltaproteobacteria bacterium]|nr:MAG: hypothetical protein DRI90_12930 [Deltaproteobacteria bacterium]
MATASAQLVLSSTEVPPPSPPPDEVGVLVVVPEEVVDDDDVPPPPVLVSGSVSELQPPEIPAIAVPTTNKPNRCDVLIDDSSANE